MILLFLVHNSALCVCWDLWAVEVQGICISQYCLCINNYADGNCLKRNYMKVRVPSGALLWHEQRVMSHKLDTAWLVCTPLTAMREARRQHYFRVPSPTHHIIIIIIIIASINISFVLKQKAGTLRIAVRAHCHIPTCLSQVSASPNMSGNTERGTRFKSQQGIGSWGFL